MCRKMIVLISFVLLLVSVSNAAEIFWSDGAADHNHLWTDPNNWLGGVVPGPGDEVQILSPEADAGHGPIIRNGMDITIAGLKNEMEGRPGKPELTMTGGNLEITDFVWWGDYDDIEAFWYHSGGAVTIAGEFELGWGPNTGGAGTLDMTGGTISAAKLVIPTGSGAYGEFYLRGGTFEVRNLGGLQVNANGLIDVSGGTLVLEGDDTTKINDLIAAGQITAYGSDGLFQLDYDDRNPGKTTLTATEGFVFLSDDFESYADDAELTAAGWTIIDTPEAIEASTWTITNPAGRGNPATLDGSASTGKFLISDSDQQSESNPVDSGASHDISTPSFSTLGYDTVWLHADVSAQLNNNGAAIFDVEVSIDGGGNWTNVFSRVAPGRVSAEGATTRLPDNTNTDGYFGRLDVDLSAVASNEPDVQVRFRHFEPNWDWWIAIDNILIDDVLAPQGGNITVFSEDFSNGLGQMNAISGQGNTGTETWHTSDKGGRYVPGAVGEQGVNRLGPHPNELPEFAIIDSDADPDPAEDEWLMTPVLNMTGLSEVFLHYDSETVMSSSVSNQEVLISLDGGNTFEASPIFAYTGGGLFDNGEEPVFAERIFDVSGIAAGESQVVFAFRYTGGGDNWWWAIDNVKVSGAVSGADNLLQNPSFEEDEAILDDPDWLQWCTWNPAEGAGSNAVIVDTDAAEGARSLLIEPVGPENWHFIVLYLPIPTEVGASYTASFWAKAVEPRSLGVQFKATDNSVSWGYTDFQLTTEWAEYALTDNAENAETKLEFFCAGVEVALLLDAVSVYKMADAPEPEEPDDGQVENLALNPSFEEDEVVLDDPTWTAWCTWNPAEGAGSNAAIVDTEAVDGARSLRVEPIGVENWHFIVANISFPLELGADFTITFWAKAEATRPLTASFKAADNSVSWGFADFELTTEWAEYSLTSTAESDAGKIEFLCAGNEVPFWIDAVSAYAAE